MPDLPTPKGVKPRPVRDLILFRLWFARLNAMRGMGSSWVWRAVARVPRAGVVPREAATARAFGSTRRAHGMFDSIKVQACEEHPCSALLWRCKEQQARL